MKYINLSISELLVFKIRTQIGLIKSYLKYSILNKKALNNTKQLKLIHKDRKVFVLANGPSMKKLDPRKICLLQKQGFHVIAVNSFISSEFGNIVKPDYYVLSDPAHFGIYSEDFSDRRKSEVQNDLKKVVENNIPLLVPLDLYQKIDYEHQYAFCDVENLCGNNVADITKPRSYLSMTAYKALSLACYLGYQEIHICGFDNDYFKTITVDENNIMYYEDEHFYQGSSDSLKYRVLDEEGSSLGELLYSHHFLFKNLEKFKKFPIINLDKNGLVDCFTKAHDLDVYLDN